MSSSHKAGSDQPQLQSALSATSFPSSAITMPQNPHRVESPPMPALPPSDSNVQDPRNETQKSGADQSLQKRTQPKPGDSFDAMNQLIGRDGFEHHKQRVHEDHELVIKNSQDDAFIQGFSQQQLDPAADKTLKEVIESITNGQMIMHKKVQYQAYSAGIDHQDHVRVVLEKLLQRQRFLNSKNKIVAYRVTQLDLNGQNVVVEGYDDDGEDGTGEKLLHLLEKMGVEDILVIVCIWHNGMPGSLRTDIFKYVLEAARNLLNALHTKVLEAAQIEEQKQLVQNYSPTPLAIQYEAQQQQQIAMLPTQVPLPVNTCNLAAEELIPPQQSAHATHLHKRAARLYRPNHFKAEVPPGAPGASISDDKLPPLRPSPVSQEEYVDAIQTAEQAIRALSKAHILQLKSTVKPHPLVQKVLIQLCVLRGVVAPSLNAAKEMLGSMTFKMELMLLDVSKLKAKCVNKVKCTLASNPLLIPSQISKYSEGAAILLTWMYNVIKWYLGYRYFLSQTVSRASPDLSPNKYSELKQQSQEFLHEQQNQLIPLGEGRDSALAGGSIHNPENFSIMQAQYQRQQEQTQLMLPAPPGQPRILTKSKRSSGRQGIVGKKTGTFLKPKQLVFGDLEVLVPKVKRKTTYPIVDPLENFPDDLKKEHLDEVEIPDIDNVTLERATLAKIMGNFIRGEGGADIPPLKQMTMRKEPTIPMPTNDEEMLIFMEKASLEEQPTEFLIQLADRMKAKRLGMEKQKD